MKNIAVLGIGNRLLMDDGIGVYIVEKLKEQNICRSIRFIVGETDIDYCLDEINEAEFLIIVDAAKLGNLPGDVTVVALDEVINTGNTGLSMHNLHLFDMLVHTGKECKGLMIGIEPFEIDYNWGLSTELNVKLPEILGTVRNIINSVVYLFM